MISQVKDDRIWVDGCFDFAHHGHAGAMLQARQHGNELYVGVHSDEEIAANKGPVVMTLPERMSAVEACKWCTKAISDAPYVTMPEFMDSYGCKYVVHGDDITTDANGDDCYRIVKDMGRFLVVKRTPNISTTDLVGRMLSTTSTSHHIPPFALKLSKITTKADLSNLHLTTELVEKFRLYATAEDGKTAHSGVFVWSDTGLLELVKPSDQIHQQLAQEKKVFYVDGGFDLFFMGHIEFLRAVRKLADEQGAIIVVGIHDDRTVNNCNGKNYPIMSLFERALCVLQCRYVDSVVLSAPWSPDTAFITAIKPVINISKILHGPTSIEAEGKVELQNPYEEAKQLGLYEEIGAHPYDHIQSEALVDRVLNHREAYEERQRKKGWKSENEKTLEALERARNEQQ
ncbi:hypothetical protein D0Z03_002739 [Geotrichum reessii]|nr:hypothetical protein D0Z03_002739 [Galactomyces reessii]